MWSSQQPLPTRAIASKPDIKAEIIALCRENLAPHKIPVIVHVVPNLPVAQSGKLQRVDA